MKLSASKTSLYRLARDVLGAEGIVYMPPQKYTDFKRCNTSYWLYWYTDYSSYAAYLTVVMGRPFFSITVHNDGQEPERIVRKLTITDLANYGMVK